MAASGLIYLGTAPARVAVPGPSHTDHSALAGSVNPLAGDVFYLGPNSKAAIAAAAIGTADPAGAAALEKIAAQPTAFWMGDWVTTASAAQTVGGIVAAAAQARSVAVFVLYGIPGRDCSGFSSGGFATDTLYSQWVAAIVRGLGAARAVVVVEPDALAQIDQPGCLTDQQKVTRLAMIQSDVHSLAGDPNATVYIDAGNPGWRSSHRMAQLLNEAGIQSAQGFSLNVSSFYSTASVTAYGNRISALVGGRHFVMDTSRNGRGRAQTWCNPPGRALGAPPTASTGLPLVDAFLWVKYPGASDGSCNGGPRAGTFWPQYAIDLVDNAAF